MIECRNCRAYFRQTPEQIGARCPDCRMPLFEKDERPRPGEATTGYCDKHARSPAAAACERCGAKVCAACKTRWNDATLCIDCQTRSVEAGEPHPRELRSEGNQAIVAFLLGIAASIFAVLAYAILWSSSQPNLGSASIWWVTLILIGLIPAFLAVGQGLSAALGRSPLRFWGLSGLLLGAAHIGLTAGLIVLNLGRN